MLGSSNLGSGHQSHSSSDSLGVLGLVHLIPEGVQLACSSHNNRTSPTIASFMLSHSKVRHTSLVLRGVPTQRNGLLLLELVSVGSRGQKGRDDRPVLILFTTWPVLHGGHVRVDARVKHGSSISQKATGHTHLHSSGGSSGTLILFLLLTTQGNRCVEYGSTWSRGRIAFEQVGSSRAAKQALSHILIGGDTVVVRH